MPYGQWKPLGRQLRTALAGGLEPTCQLRPYSTRSPAHCVYCLPHLNERPRAAHASTGQHTASAGYQTVASVAVDPSNVDKNRVEPNEHDSRAFRAHSWRRLRRLPRTDYITEALRNVGKHHLAPCLPRRKRDLSHTDVQSHNAWAKSEWSQSIDWANSSHLSLQLLVGKCIQHVAAAPNDSSFGLSPLEARYLNFKGIEIDDVHVWAEILSTEDTFAAASILNKRTAQRDIHAVPIFVYLQLLRRRSISARALQILLENTKLIFKSRLETELNPGIDHHPLFIAVIRLIRHAREVWPQAMPSIVELYLHHLDYRKHLQSTAKPLRLERQTYLLNKLMSLISISTAVQPFKDNHYQETAVVQILRYMSEHDPPLQINREGYRAFIRFQMSQKKTSNELQWAELKSLSWPPWKLDRTAMDAAIGPDYGITKAGETLRQMRGAGYASLAWEQAGEIYMGWDTDRTPTIQTRTVLGKIDRRFSTQSALWVARIDCTRTVQEAWACYLAWEDEKLPSDDEVYLAVFRKLYQEEHRKTNEPMKNRGQRQENGEAWTLLPGDNREVEPPPPSLHLHTYTRTPPPSVNRFYDQLKKRGIVAGGHCLAFLVTNADTLQSGIQRLEDSTSRYPNLSELLTVPPSDQIREVPTHILAATAELFARFAHVTSTQVLVNRQDKSMVELPNTPTLDGQKLNHNHLLVHAVELLRLSRTTFRPAWNSVLHGLTREACFLGMKAVLTNPSMKTHSRTLDYLSAVPTETNKCAGAIVAYRLVRRILSLLRENHLELDVVGFHRLCIATENLAIATWVLVKTDPSISSDSPQHQGSFLAQERGIAKNVLRSKSHYVRLQGEFKILVGEHSQNNGSAVQTSASQTGNFPHDKPNISMPRFLTVPSPSLLHAYVRGLGWMADYDGLSTLVDWMSEYQLELAERKSQDRSGEAMMRRTIVAIRVFLERSWLSPPSEDSRSEDEIDSVSEAESSRNDGHAQEDSGRARKLLQRLERPASVELVDHVRETIGSVEQWGPWPSDEEVEDYCTDYKFERVRS